MSNIIELSKDSYMWRTLKAMYPNEDDFYSRYIDGDYYNTAHTEYLNNDGKVIYSQNHGWYG